MVPGRDYRAPTIETNMVRIRPARKIIFKISSPELKKLLRDYEKKLFKKFQYFEITVQKWRIFCHTTNRTPT